eukprot:314031_1
MKLFDRTPTGRTLFRRRPSYSKEYKPFLHKLKRIFGNKKSQFVVMGLCCISVLFLLLITYSPKVSPASLPIPNEHTATSSNESIHLQPMMDDTQSQDTKSSLLSDLMHQFIANPDAIDMEHIEQLLMHRDDLQKQLKKIDDLLVRHKEKISAVLPTKSAQNEPVPTVPTPSKYKLNKSPQEIRGEIIT